MAEEEIVIDSTIHCLAMPDVPEGSVRAFSWPLAAATRLSESSICPQIWKATSCGASQSKLLHHNRATSRST
jgi:hypothetical protein